MKKLIFLILFPFFLHAQVVVYTPLVAVVGSATDPNLLPGMTRIVPKVNYFTTTDNQIYTQQNTFGQQISVGYQMLGDGQCYIKAPTAADVSGGGYGNDFELTTGVSDGGYADFYFEFGSNSILWELTNTSGQSLITGNETITQGAFYGFQKASNHILVVKTMDGITFTTLADFGTVSGYIYLSTYDANGSCCIGKLYHPQGVGLTAF